MGPIDNYSVWWRGSSALQCHNGLSTKRCHLTHNTLTSTAGRDTCMLRSVVRRRTAAVTLCQEALHPQARKPRSWSERVLNVRSDQQTKNEFRTRSCRCFSWRLCTQCCALHVFSIKSRRLNGCVLRRKQRWMANRSTWTKWQWNWFARLRKWNWLTKVLTASTSL